MILYNTSVRNKAIVLFNTSNGMEVNGRAIDVKIASPKENRPKKKEAPANQSRGNGGGHKKNFRPKNNRYKQN